MAPAFLPPVVALVLGVVAGLGLGFVVAVAFVWFWPTGDLRSRR